ncbi:MAG: DNA polymerase III subunit delta [Bacteroidaceae bacterium]|nr:DNA polymerase III subunit delta [Bacteroidaceae bacterium]MBR1755532.1 DNA polymerase III subunit delta [Bacteroidaceae bacterium]
MAKKAAGVSYEDIVRQVRAGDFQPIYCLMGEEPYYIDRISDYIVEQALTEDERDFNLTILYGPQTTGEEVINAARRYPMMAERQVVVVREAQSLPHKEVLAFYAQKPMPSTVLVLCHKNGVLDGRTNMAKELRKAGVVFESNKLYDRELPGFAVSYVRRKHAEITPDACQILCEHVGADLSRLAGELDKLIVAVGEGNRIDAQSIQDHIGISKEYNSFELVAALSVKDVVKANRIVKYFNSNPKNWALQPTLSTLFKFFSDMMLAYYAPVKSEQGIADWLGQSAWQVRRNILPAMRYYTAMKVFTIIAEIRRTDGASKGVGGQKTSDGDLLKELIYQILH